MYIDDLTVGQKAIVSKLHLRITNDVELISRGFKNGAEVEMLLIDSHKMLVSIMGTEVGLSKSLAGCIEVEIN